MLWTGSSDVEKGEAAECFSFRGLGDLVLKMVYLI